MASDPREGSDTTLCPSRSSEAPSGPQHGIGTCRTTPRGELGGRNPSLLLWKQTTVEPLEGCCTDDVPGWSADLAESLFNH